MSNNEIEHLDELEENIVAICNRAVQLEMGLEDDPNPELAAKLWKKAAGLGSCFAIQKLCSLYKKGQLRDDDVEKTKWFQKAKELGSPDLDKLIKATSWVPEEKRSKILVADDGPDTIRLLEYILSKDGYEVVSAQDGVEARKVLGENPDVELILLDLQMPNANGFQFLESIGAGRGELYAKVAVLTAHTKLDLIQRAKKLHVEAWIKKPVERSKVLEVVDKLLKDKNEKVD